MRDTPVFSGYGDDMPDFLRIISRSRPVRSAAVRRAVGALFLCGLAALLYGPVLHAPFQFDDYDFILNNPSIRDPADVGAIWGNLSQPSRFVPFYSFALNYAISGYDPAGFRLTNILIHIANALCVWGIAAHAVNRTSRSGPTLRLHPEIIGWIAAAIFIAHPVQTQAVTYITQRFASLATLFYLLSVTGYIAGRESQRAGRGGRAGMFFAGTAVCAMMGMFSKEFAMTLPLILILYDFAVFQDGVRLKWGKLTRWMLAIVPVMLIVPAIFSFRPQVLFHPRPSSSHHGDIITLPGYLMTQIRVFAKFLQLLVFPVSQNLEYDFPLSRTLVDPAVIGSGIVLIALLAAGIRLWRFQRAAALGIFWFFLSLASHLVPRRYVIAEHKLYVASVGFCLALAVLMAVALPRRNRFVMTMAIIIMTFGVLCVHRNQVWSDPVILWTDVTRKSPAKPRAWLMLGQAYTERGEFTEAVGAYDRAIQLDPALARAYHNRGKVYAQMQDYQAALADYSAALKYNPKLADVYNNRGNALRHLRDYRQALEDYAEAIRLDPEYPEAYNNRGIVYKKMKSYDKAVEDFSTAIRLDPTYAVVYNNRGNLLYQLGRPDAALRDYNRAIDLYLSRPQTAQTRSQLAITHLNRALYYGRRREFKQAHADAERAYELGYAGAGRYVRMWQAALGGN